jgi:aminoglycoside 2''-phosphotransferase
MSQTSNRPSLLLQPFALTSGELPPLEQVQWLGEGHYCDCYLVNDTHVFRFAKHAAASVAMQSEQCLLPILQQHLSIALPHPTITGIRTDTGNAMMGYPYLEGEPLEDEVVVRLSPSNRTSLIAQMVAFTRSLHAIPLDEVQSCGIRHLDLLPHLARIMAQGRERVASLLPNTVWDYYESLFADYTNDPALHTYTPTLLHGDLSPDHFLGDAKEGVLTGVIDFGDACIGDPTWDLIYICEDYDEAIFQTFIAQYDPVNTVLLERKVRLYQHLNNVDYALSVLAEEEEGEVEEALEILTVQAVQA